MTRALGPWRALGLLILAYAVLNTAMQLGRPALLGLIGPTTPMQLAAVRLTSSSIFLWLMLGVVGLIMRARAGPLLAESGFPI